jgi:hypothetical protein
MKHMDMLDFAFVLHFLYATVLMNTPMADLLVAFEDMSGRSAVFAGLFLLLGALYSFFIALTYYFRKELIGLFLLLLASSLINQDWLHLIYFSAALAGAIAWFFFWRKPPFWNH